MLKDTAFGQTSDSFCPSLPRNGYKVFPMFGDFSYCCCLPLLPGFACSIHATWDPPLSRALYTFPISLITHRLTRPNVQRSLFIISHSDSTVASTSGRSALSSDLTSLQSIMTALYSMSLHKREFRIVDELLGTGG